MAMLYDELLIEFGNPHLIIKEKNLPISKGRIKGNRIAINKNLTLKEKACVLAEEMGHYCTTVGNILDQSDASNQKQELRARLWAYNKMVGLDGIIKAYKHGCKELYDTAEFLDVTEDFLKETLNIYSGKYGTYVEYKGYIITFIPTLDVYLK